MIKLSQYGVKIDGSSLGEGQGMYESKVFNLVDGISVHSVGAALLWAISTHGVCATIKPHPKVECNAVGGTDEFGVGFVSYTPDQFMPGSSKGCNHANTAGADPREILFHELVHVLRAVAGKWRQGRIGALRAIYTNDEEFIAVMLTNIYSSQRGRPTRESHAGFVPLAQTSFSTLQSAAKILLIEVVKRDHPEMFRRIADNRAPYNPLREYGSL